MIKVPINDNYVMPTFQIINKNPEATELILIDPQTTSLYLLHQYYCTDSQDYAELIALLETQAVEGIQSPYVLNPVVYLPIKYTNEQFQTSHFVQVLYEYGSHTLEQQLYLRIQEKNYFQEHQIWSILGSIILGLKNLKDKQFTHSSICMGDIFVTKQGQIKICHPMFRTYDHKNSQLVEQHYFQRAINENYYFAPEQLPKVQKYPISKSFSRHYANADIQQQQNQLPEITLQDMFKSDIFSSGMTILSLCMLYPVNDCYTKRATKNSYCIYVESDRVNQYFTLLEQTYSQELLNFLFSMVSYQIEERVSIDQLAMVIEEMIQAKQLQEQEQYEEEEIQQSNGYNRQNQSIRKNQSNQESSNIKTSQERYGKFSRVHQASPLSGRKTARSIHHRYGAAIEAVQGDVEDRPSLVSVECEVDYANIDIDEENNLKESQVGCQQNGNLVEGHNRLGLHAQIKHEVTRVNTQQTTNQQSISQTLRQYINTQMSSILQVNQTRTQEQDISQKQKKRLWSPEYVNSVMTSKELCSLAGEESKVGEEGKESLNKGNNNKKQVGANNSLKGYLATIREHNKCQGQQQTEQQPIVQVFNKNEYKSDNRRRGWQNGQECKENDRMGGNWGVGLGNEGEGVRGERGGEGGIRQQNNNQKKKERSQQNEKKQQKEQQQQQKREKQIREQIKPQHNLSHNNSQLYTDPQLLKLIRQDVNKILSKRKLSSITSGNTISIIRNDDNHIIGPIKQTHTVSSLLVKYVDSNKHFVLTKAGNKQQTCIQRQIESNNILINGRMLSNSNKFTSNNIHHLPIPITYLSKPTHYNPISHIR